MRNLLFLAHRLPFPPNKGDKVRSFHLLKHLAARNRVFLGTFIDDPQDEIHIESLSSHCAGMHVARLNPPWARFRSLMGLVRCEALTLPYYRDAGLRAWVEKTVREEGVDTAVVFSSAMAQYVNPIQGLRTVVDFVDVDSAKWQQYSTSKQWPYSWIYRRESRRLLAHEKATADRASRSFFVTEAEADLFLRLAPAHGEKVGVMGNGVDASYFSPDHSLASPFRDGEVAIVFTGAMDYFPNADAACWFAKEVLPGLRKRWPNLRFHVVGMRPSPAVKALDGEAVSVTGAVPDVRPYLRHAAVVVAPMRVARGVQNKALEAMAMARPVVASKPCATGLDARVGYEFEVAYDAPEFIERVGNLLQEPERAAAMGRAARERILARYSWDAHLSVIDRHLDGDTSGDSPWVIQPSSDSPSMGGLDMEAGR